MRKLVLSGFVLLGISEIMASTTVVEGFVQPDDDRSHPATVAARVSSLEDILSTDSSIVLLSGRVLAVDLDEALRMRLLAESRSKTQTITARFLAYFEETKLASVSDKVIGFWFGLDDQDGIYRQTFLGRNAK